MTMRPLLALALLLPLTACSGFGHFLGDTVWIDTNRNAPQDQSENNSRVWGDAVNVPQLQPEPGDVWPSGPINEPSLEDIANHPNDYPLPKLELESGAPHAQPRPAALAPGTSHLPSVHSDAVPNGSAPRPPADPGYVSGGGAVGSSNNFRVLTSPNGTNGGVIIPNGNGTSTIIGPDGQVKTVPTPH